MISTDTQIKEFAGIPVKGDIERNTPAPPDQRPIEDLERIISNVLSFPEVEAIRWQQYTPYFNDGEPCVFSVYGYVTLTADSDDDDGLDFFSIKAVRDCNKKGEGIPSWYSKYCDMRPEFLEALFELAPVEEGAFDLALQREFGDPTEVVITRDEVTLSYCEHD